MRMRGRLRKDIDGAKLMYDMPMLKRSIAKLALLLPLLFLSSCQQKVEFNGSEVFFSGEIRGFRYEDGDDYAKFCRPTTGEDIVNKVNQGETVFLLFAAGDCSHCQKLRPKMCEYLSKKPIETHLLYTETVSEPSAFRAEVAKITNAFPSMAGALKGKFPTGYILSSPEKVEEISFSGHFATYGDLQGFMDETIRGNGIYRYEKEEGFAGFLQETKSVGYVYSSSISAFLNDEMPSLSAKKKDMAILPSSAYEEGYYRYGDHLEKIEKKDALGILGI